MTDYRLKDIARIIGGAIIGDEETVIIGINSLEAARSGELSFFSDQRYKDLLPETGASALIVRERTRLFKGPQIVVADPGLAYAKVAKRFVRPVVGFKGVSDQAFIDERCRVGRQVTICPGAYVGEGAEIGDRSVLFPGVFIGDRVRVGHDALIYPNVAILQDCVIGNRVIIHAGTVIGSDGFGFVRDGAESIKIPQLGIVQIDDDVEIGANNCIDRAALGKTWIKRGVKTDNLIQVAHNVVIGEHTVILAQAGIAGSVRIGREVIVAGQVGIADHVEIGERTIIGPQSGVAKNIGSGDVVFGTPTMPHRTWLKTRSLIVRLPGFAERLREMEKKIKKLETEKDKESI